MRRLILLLAVCLSAVCAASAAIPADSVADSRVHFAWGADFGSSIDLSAHDMSSIDFNAAFGIRYRWITFFGLGAGADIMVSNSCRTYPVFATFRTSFSPRPKIMFMDLRGGVALNYLPHNIQQTGAYVSAAVGFNLARSRKFTSYITAGYTLVTRSEVTNETGTQPYDNLNYAAIRLGVQF